MPSRARLLREFYLRDHAFFRDIRPNRHRVDAHLWRSAQPAPRHIARFAQAGGRTVINLRGQKDQAFWHLESEACAAHGLALIDFPIDSRDLPDVPRLLRARALLESLQVPALAHCKSGADRAGLFAALYLLGLRGRPVAEAARQLSWRFGHIRHAKTGLLDHFLTAYARDTAATGVPFWDWVETAYDPAAERARFRETWWAGVLTDRLLRRE